MQKWLTISMKTYLTFSSIFFTEPLNQIFFEYIFVFNFENRIYFILIAKFICVLYSNFQIYFHKFSVPLWHGKIWKCINFTWTNFYDSSLANCLHIFWKFSAVFFDISAVMLIFERTRSCTNIEQSSQFSGDVSIPVRNLSIELNYVFF